MTKQRQFPNKMIQMAYNSAIGKSFTWSPTFQKFTDEDCNSDYDYSAMLWLKENNWLFEQPCDTSDFVLKFRVK